jgi:hypothetical protein
VSNDGQGLQSQEVPGEQVSNDLFMPRCTSRIHPALLYSPGNSFPGGLQTANAVDLKNLPLQTETLV